MIELSDQNPYRAEDVPPREEGVASLPPDPRARQRFFVTFVVISAAADVFYAPLLCRPEASMTTQLFGAALIGSLIGQLGFMAIWVTLCCDNWDQRGLSILGCTIATVCSVAGGGALLDSLGVDTFFYWGDVIAASLIAPWAILSTAAPVGLLLKSPGAAQRPKRFHVVVGYVFVLVMLILTMRVPSLNDRMLFRGFDWLFLILTTSLCSLFGVIGVAPIAWCAFGTTSVAKGAKLLVAVVGAMVLFGVAGTVASDMSSGVPFDYSLVLFVTMFVSIPVAAGACFCYVPCIVIRRNGFRASMPQRTPEKRSHDK